MVLWGFCIYGGGLVNPRIRATAVLIEEDKILLVEQKVSERRSWSLPGGTLEIGETLEQCIIREVKEETGLEVQVEKLLYICDCIDQSRHVVHVTFLVRRIGGCMVLGYEPEEDANPIKSVEMVSIKLLSQYGFSEKFSDLVREGFPGSGTYKGLISNIGL